MLEHELERVLNNNTTSRLGRPRHQVVQVAAYYPPHLGGLEKVVQTVSELLAERHDVTVITTTCGAAGAPTREEKAGVLVRRFLGFTFANTPLSLGLLLRLMMVGRRSIVHVHVAHAFVPEVVLLASIVRRYRYVAHFHVDVDPKGRFGVFLNGYKRWILGPCLRRAAAVIALTGQQADFLKSYHGVLPERIIVIPNGVEPAFYRVPSEDEDTRVARQGARLLYVGRLDREKGLPRLIDAMKNVSSNVELVIVGDGQMRKELADQIDQLGLTTVRLAGPAHGADLVRWYRWADMFVLPSDKEGMPLAALEAMAAGLAVVATDVSGTRDLVEGVGLLTELDSKSLGAAIDRVAADPDLLSKLSARSMARAAEFDWNPRITDIEHLYDSLSMK